MSQTPPDPSLAQLDDVDGTACYTTLGLDKRCSQEDVKKVQKQLDASCMRLERSRCFLFTTTGGVPTTSSSLQARPHPNPQPDPHLSPQAYRRLARTLHPDKGGRPEAFSALQHAFEVLIDPKRRAVYDTWAAQLQYRSVRIVAQQAVRWVL